MIQKGEHELNEVLFWVCILISRQKYLLRIFQKHLNYKLKSELFNRLSGIFAYKRIALLRF